MLPFYYDSKGVNVSLFKEIDYECVNSYSLPIELMMENAGLHLAKLIAKYVQVDNDSIIQIGVGNGNNGGGGLVAARRLAAWGYDVRLDIPYPITKELPKVQLERALAFGVTENAVMTPTVWVDAYLGFSQRIPLSEPFQRCIARANTSKSFKIALDLPTGYSGSRTHVFFNSDVICTLAALKTELLNLPDSVEIYVADLGIPHSLYDKFGIAYPPFHLSSILKLKRETKE